MKITSRLPTLLLGTLATFIVFYCFRPIANLDIGWHLATGRYIVGHHTIPLTDVFTFTCFGQKWINNYWFYELILYGFFGAAGFAGVQVFNALLALLIFYPVYRRLRARAVYEPVAVVAVLAAFWASRLSSISGGERASLVTFLFLSWMFWHLERVDYGTAPKRSLWIWPLCFSVWVNSHPGFVLGLIIIGVYGLGQMIRKPTAIKFYVLWGVSCALATLINPFGFSAYDVLGKAVTHSESIGEWVRTPWTHFELFWIFLAGFWLIRPWKRCSLSFMGIGIVLSGLSIRYVLNVPFFVVFAVPIVFQQVSGTRIGIRVQDQLSRHITWVYGLTFVVLCLFAVGAGRRMASGMQRATFPVEGCDFIEREALTGPFYNTYGFGGYWIWRFAGHPPDFIDGRFPTVKGFDPLLTEIHTAQHGTPIQWQSFLKKWGVNAALLEYPTPQPGVSVYEYYFPAKDWALVYWDDICLIYLKRIPLHAAVIKRNEFTHIHPDLSSVDLKSQLPRASRSQRAGLLRDVQRNLQSHPDSQRTRRFLDLIPSVNLP